MSKKLNEASFLLCALSLALMGSPASASFAETDILSAGSLTAQDGADSITISSSIAISGSLNLQGASGLVSGESSATASAFFGDGSHLIGVPLPASSPTLSGINTFASSFSVKSSGQQISLSTSSTSNNITVSAAGITSFFPQLHNSSGTAMPAYTTTAQSLGTCVPGSTVTITTSGGAVELSFFGYISNGTGTVVGFLQDGRFAPGFSTSIGLMRETLTFPADGLGGSFNYLLDPPSAGSHSYCISVANANNPSNSILLWGTPDLVENQFFVEEIK